MAVWLCPGQGAQAVHMGADLLDCGDFPRVGEAFELGSQVLELDLAALAREGSAADVDDAFNAQALTAALTIGIGRELLARGQRPQAVVGFSLGQLSALALSGMLSDEDAFSLLKVRAEAMAAACAEHSGAMTALLGCSVEDADAVCAACAGGQVLVPANYNCPGQVVLSGELPAIERAEAAWAAEHGARKLRRLRTAGAFHSPLMEQAAAATGAAARKLRFAEPSCPVLCNTDARPMTAASAAQRMELQVKSPVRFQQSIQALLGEGFAEYAEIGFGGVLANLVKRMDRSTARHPLGTVEELRAYLG